MWTTYNTDLYTLWSADGEGGHLCDLVRVFPEDDRSQPPVWFVKQVGAPAEKIGTQGMSLRQAIRLTNAKFSV